MSWSKRIRIVFDRKVYNVTPALKDCFRLVETTYGTYVYPINVTYGVNDHEIYLEFADFYRAVQPLSLEYLGGTSFGGKDFNMEAFILTPIILNVNPSDADEYLSISSININGEIIIAFDGKAYSDDYISASISVAGAITQLIFTSGYAKDNYLQVGSIGISGQYCDINGVPL